MLLNYFKHEKINNHGDRVLIKQSKWAFYLLNVKNKNCIWHKIQDNIEKLSDTGDVTFEDIDTFLDQNPEIEFELDFFIPEMPEIFFFKIKNKMYCYSCESLIFDEKTEKKVKVRFYFDYKKLLNINS